MSELELSINGKQFFDNQKLPASAHADDTSVLQCNNLPLPTRNTNTILQKYNAKKYKNTNADVLLKTDHPLHSTRVSAPSSKLFPPSRQIAREGRQSAARRCENSVIFIDDDHLDGGDGSDDDDDGGWQVV